tara:strand:- start:5029 stop:5220 length:192 start_codon:yes stop_codon:yes gene_type:complete
MLALFNEQGARARRMWREIDNCAGRLTIFMLILTAFETFFIMYVQTEELKLFKAQQGQFYLDF